MPLGTTGAFGRVIFRIDERGRSYLFTITFHAALQGENELTWPINPKTNLFNISLAHPVNQAHHIVGS